MFAVSSRRHGRPLSQANIWSSNADPSDSDGTIDIRNSMYRTGDYIAVSVLRPSLRVRKRPPSRVRLEPSWVIAPAVESRHGDPI
jgi:hypothetical protein